MSFYADWDFSEGLGQSIAAGSPRREGSFPAADEARCKRFNPQSFPIRFKTAAWKNRKLPYRCPPIARGRFRRNGSASCPAASSFLCEMQAETMKALLGSLVGSVKKGVHPRHVGVAVFLGSLAGFTTGWNLTLVAVLLLALLLRHHWKVFFQSWGAFYALSWLMTPWCYRTGRYLLDGGTLGRWLAPHADSLWLALWDLDRYTLVGGVFWGALVGLGAGYLAAALTRTLQAAAARVQDHVEQKQGKTSRLAWRLLCRVVFGGPRVQPAPASRPRWISWAGVAVLVAVVVPGAALGYLVLPNVVWYGVNNALWMANGAEVEADRVELSLARGWLQIHRLQVANPNNLQQNRLQIEQVVAVVRPGPLLRGRVVADRILLNGVEVDVPRAVPARAWEMTTPGLDFPELAPSLLSQEDADSGESAKEGDATGDSLDADAWRRYLQQGEQWKERLAQLQRWVKLLERIGGSEPETQAEQQQVPKSWVAMRQARCRFGRPCPRVWIGQVLVRRLPQKWGLGSEAAMQIVNITSRPQALGKPTRLELLAPECGLELLADFNFHRRDLSHAVAVQWRHPRPQQLIRLPEELPLRATPGRVLVQGQGWFTAKTIQLPLKVRARELAWQTSPSGKLWGVDAQVWKQAVVGIDSLELHCRLEGQWNKPQLHVDTRRLLAQLQQHFQQAGYEALAQALSQQAGALQEKARQQLAQAKRELKQQLDTQKAKLQEAKQQAEEKLAGLQDQVKQEVQQKVQQGKQSLAQATQKAQEQLSQQTEQLRQQAADQAGRLARQTAQAVEKPLEQTAQKAQQATNLFQQLQQQTQGAKEQLSQLNQQTRQLGQQVQQSTQQAKEVLEQLTRSTTPQGAARPGGSSPAGGQEPQPLVRKNPFVNGPLTVPSQNETQPEKPSPETTPSGRQVFVPESVATTMPPEAPSVPKRNAPSQAELEKQLGVQVVEKSSRKPSPAPELQRPAPAVSQNVPQSLPLAGEPGSPAKEPEQFYGDPLAIATDQPQRAPAPVPAAPTERSPRYATGIPAAGGVAPGVSSGRKLSGQLPLPNRSPAPQETRFPAGTDAVANRPSQSGTQSGARPASFASGKPALSRPRLSHQSQQLPQANPPAAKKKSFWSSLPLPRWSRRSQSAQEPLARQAPQEKKPPLWKRMSDGVSSGMKRLWPFGKKPAPEQTATVPPAQYGRPDAAPSGQREPLPQLEPPMPVQQAQVPWYKKLFRR